MSSPHNDPEVSPAALLHRIQELFRKLGRLGERLTVSHGGRQYLVCCDETAFTVYRLVEECHLPPGRPGWPVCLVTAETSIDETTPPLSATDEFSSGLTLMEWVELIEQTFQS